MYDVGITIHLIDRVTGQLGIVSRALTMAGAHTAGVNQRLEQLHGRLMQIHAVGAIGEQMFRLAGGALESTIEPAKEYVHLTNMMNMQGLKMIEIEKNKAAAFKTSQDVITSTSIENLKVLNDVSSIIGRTTDKLAEARELLPSFQKMTAIFAGSSEGKVAANADQQAKLGLKAIESMGQVASTKQIEHHLEQMTKVAIATSGNVLPADYQNVLKYARQAKMTMNDDFLYGVLPEIIIEMKGRSGSGGGNGGPGAMIAALTRIGLQGIMSKATAGNLQELGLLQNPILKTTTTGTTVTGSGGLVNQGLLAADPEKWTRTIFVPALLKHHKDLAAMEKDVGNDPTKRVQFNVALAMEVAKTLKGNQLAVALFQELGTRGFQFEKFKQNVAQVPGMDESYKRALGSPVNADKAFEAGLVELKTILGLQIMPVLIPALKSLGTALKGMANFFQQHPLAAKLAVATLAATAFVGGVIALVAAIAPAVIVCSLFGVSIGGVAAAITGAIALITITIMSIGTKSVDMAHVVTKAFTGLGTWLDKSLSPTLIACQKGFQNMGGSITAFVNNSILAFQNGFNTLIAIVNGGVAGLITAFANGFAQGKQKATTEAPKPFTPQNRGTTNQTNQISFNIHQQPGQSSDDLAHKVVAMLGKEIMHGVMNSTVGMGSYESYAFQGA